MKPIRKMLEHSDLFFDAFSCGLLIVCTKWGQGHPWILKADKKMVWEH